MADQPLIPPLPDSRKDFERNPRQAAANRVLCGPARHVMLYGGARSGKTFVIMRAIITRALAHKSRHACLRYRFNHIKTSIIYDTLPRVLELCFGQVGSKCHLDKQDGIFRLPNGSEIWFGGLDDKERTEKILGQEFSTLYLNECSQIPWPSRNIAITRLAQNTPLRLKAYYDCNPPSVGHWTYRLFILKQNPEDRTALRDRDAYTHFTLNPIDNQGNLKPETLAELQALPAKMRKRFWLGEFASEGENALWSMAQLDRARHLEGVLPDMQRIVIAVDPSGCQGAEDERSDEIGIIVAGLGADGRGYVLEDLSGKFGPAEWGKVVVAAYDRHEANCVVAETNFGGAMVGEIIRAARPPELPRIPFREVRASRGKVVRAEPIAALYEQGKVVHVGYFERLEDQLCSMTTAGYMGDRSPDRADALVWALNELFPALTRRETVAQRGYPQVNLGYAHMKRRAS